MASASSASIWRFLEESTPGTIESGNPQTYRVSGGTITQSVEFDDDNELRNDRGSGASTLVSGSVAGSLNINWSHKTHDAFLEALMAAAFVPVSTNSVITVADAVFTQSTHIISSATAALPNLEKGQWFGITGSTAAGNNDIFKCSSSVEPTTSAITVDTAVRDIVTATSDSIVISGARLKQGYVDLRTFTLERELSDVVKFFTWKECYVSALNLSYAIGGKLNGTVSFMGGATEERGVVSKFPGIATDVAATTTSYFNTINGSFLLVDGVAMGDSCIESFTLDVNAGLREVRCISSGIAPTSISTDPFVITGTANVFFGSDATATLYDKKLTGLPITFTVCVVDPSNNAFAVTFPAATITSAEVDGGSIGSDVMMTLNFKAYTDATFATQLIIDRVGSMA